MTWAEAACQSCKHFLAGFQLQGKHPRPELLDNRPEYFDSGLFFILAGPGLAHSSFDTASHVDKPLPFDVSLDLELTLKGRRGSGPDYRKVHKINGLHLYNDMEWLTAQSRSKILAKTSRIGVFESLRKARVRLPAR